MIRCIHLNHCSVNLAALGVGWNLEIFIPVVALSNDLSLGDYV